MCEQLDANSGPIHIALDVCPVEDTRVLGLVELAQGLTDVMAPIIKMFLAHDWEICVETRDGRFAMTLTKNHPVESDHRAADRFAEAFETACKKVGLQKP